MMPPTLAALGNLHPNTALFVFTLGVGFIYLELNRPGSILPGAIGLLAVLISVASFVSRGTNLPGVALVLVAASLLLLDLLRPTPILVAVAATFALIFGLRGLLSPSCCPSFAFPAYFTCGLVLGAGTSYLTRIARRARVNKGLD